MTRTVDGWRGMTPREYPEEWELNGRRDPLKPADRASMAAWSCDRCGAMLLSLEVGPHYRARHPEDRPEVTRR